MLKGFKQCADAIVIKGAKAKKIKNFKIDREEKVPSVIYIYHYGNIVACVNIELKKILKHPTYWNYSKSTTRLCNDILSYFNGYTVLN